MKYHILFGLVTLTFALSGILLVSLVESYIHNVSVFDAIFIESWRAHQ